MADTMTIVLRTPVEHAGVTYDKLDLREPTAAELEMMNAQEGTGADIFSLSLIAGVPRQAIGKIGARDLLKGVRFIASFLAEDPSTGREE